MNYLSDEWVEQQLAELEQQKEALNDAIAEIRETTPVVKRLRAAVGTAQSDMAKMRSEIIELRAEVQAANVQRALDVSTGVGEPIESVAVAAQFDLHTAIIEQTEAIAALRAAEIEARADREELRSMLMQLKTEADARRDRVERLRSVFRVGNPFDRSKRGIK